MEQFKSALRAFFVESCSILVGEPNQQRSWTRIIRQGGGSTSLPVEIRNDFSSSLIRFQMRILDDKIPSFNSLVEAVREDSQLRDALLVDAAGTPITDGKNQGWWLNSMVIMPLLNVYVQRVGGFNYDEAIFDELFAVVQNDIESTEITITQLSPLMNVEIESEQIQIDTNVRLRQLSTDELEEWLNANTQFSFEPISPMELLNLKSAVEVVYCCQSAKWDTF